MQREPPGRPLLRQSSTPLVDVSSFLYVPRSAGFLPMVLLAVVLVTGCDSGGGSAEEQGDSVPKVAAEDFPCVVVEPFGAAASQFDYSDSLVTSVSEIIPAQTETGGSVPDGHVVTGLSASAAGRDGGVDIQALHLQHREVLRDGSLGPRARTIFAVRTDENCEAPPDLDDPFPEVPDGHVATGAAVAHGRLASRPVDRPHLQVDREAEWGLAAAGGGRRHDIWPAERAKRLQRCGRPSSGRCSAHGSRPPGHEHRRTQRSSED